MIPGLAEAALAMSQFDRVVDYRQGHRDRDRRPD